MENATYALMIVALCMTGVVVGSVVYIKYLKPNHEGINYGGVTLSADDYEAIQKKFDDYSTVAVCNIDTNDCITLTNIDKLNGISN